MSDITFGYFWHVECIYATGTRRDDAGKPEGDFVQRARLQGHIKDAGEIPVCHYCVKHGSPDARAGSLEDFVVLSYELAEELCDCEYARHNARLTNRALCDDVWTLKLPRVGEEGKEGEGMGLFVCAECWYKDHDMPPEREERPNGANCQRCDDYVTEVVFVSTGDEKKSPLNSREDVMEYDLDGVTMRVTWSRRVIKDEYYAFDVALGEDEIELLNDGDGEAINEIVHNLAHDESDEGNVYQSDFYDYVDGDCPEDVEWEVV